MWSRVLEIVQPAKVTTSILSMFFHYFASEMFCNFDSNRNVYSFFSALTVWMPYICFLLKTTKDTYFAMWREIKWNPATKIKREREMKSNSSLKRENKYFPNIFHWRNVLLNIFNFHDCNVVSKLEIIDLTNR